MLFNNPSQPPTGQQTPPQSTNQQSPNSFQGQMFRRKSSPHLRVKIFGVLAAMLLVVGLPVVLFVSQTQQKTGSHASTPASTAALQHAAFTCTSAAVDIVLVVDNSGSMSSTLGTGGTKIASAISAAQHFVDTLSQNTNNKVSLVTFSTTATLNMPLTNNFASVKTAIGNIKATNNTCTQCGIDTANAEIAKDGRAGLQKVVILLTDGIANTVAGNTNQVSASVAETGAITSVKAGFAANKTTFFTIGLGNKNGDTNTGINEPFLQQIATLTAGQYFYSPNSSQLDGIYQTISTIIGKGSIAGVVYNDINRTNSYDTSDAPLASWKVDLKDSTNTSVIATATTDATGAYSFTGVCDASYTVSEELQTGWTQTNPTNPNYYSVTLSNGSNNPDKNFANVQNLPSPTACITPNQIQNVKVTCANCSTQ